MTATTPPHSPATETPNTSIPALPGQKQPPRKTAHDEIADAENREKIALGVLIASILAIVTTSCVVVWNAKDKEAVSQRVMDSTLPLYGTWVGTILAFYFSRNAFEAASSATTRNAALFQQVTRSLPPSDNVLTKIVLKSLANDLVFSQNDLNKPLQQVLDELIAKNRCRTIVIDADKRFVDLVYRNDAAAFLTPPGDGQPPSPPPTLKKYLDWRNNQGEQAKPTVVFLPQSATLADADAKLNETIGCRDVIVTTDGKGTSPVVVYVTDVDVNKNKNTRSSLAA